MKNSETPVPGQQPPNPLKNKFISNSTSMNGQAAEEIEANTRKVK